jgi:PAS domain S-box-containing protein
MRLLLVEDSSPDTMAIERVVCTAQRPYDCVVANTVAQAVHHLQTQLFDLILARYKLPDGDALALLPVANNTPLVLLAELGEETAVAHALQSGAADYLIKDKQNGYLALLVVVLERALERSQRPCACQNEATTIIRDALHATEQHLRAVLTAIPDLVFRVHRDGTFLDYYVTRSDMLIMSPELFLGKNVCEVMPPVVAAQAMIHIEKATQSDEETAFEYDLTLDDRTRNFEARIIRFGADDFLIIVREVTEWRQAMQALHVSEVRYRQMFEMHGLPKLIIDPHTGQITDANLAATLFYGCDLERLKTRTIFELTLTPQENVLARIAAALASPTMLPEELQQVGADGHVRDVELFGGMVMLKGRPHLYAIITDVTEKVQSKKALEEAQHFLEQRVIARTAELAQSELRYRSLFNQSNDAVFLLDTARKHLQVNQRAADLLGYTPEEIIGLSTHDLVVPEEWAASDSVHQRLLNREPIPIYIRTFRCKDGRPLPVEINVEMVWDENNEPLHIQSIVRDITERRQMIESLRQSEQRLEMAASAGGIGVWDWAVQQDKLLWDRRMCILYGREPAQSLVNYETWTLALHPDDRKRAMAQMKAALQGREPFNIEFRVVWPDGSIKYLLGLASVLRDPDGTPIRMVGINMDITTRKESEEILRSALEKERELGELKTRFVSMTSHEFRTPLATILATTETLTIYRYRMTESQIDARLEKIRQQVNHLKAMMDDVLQLARIQAERIRFNPAHDDLDGLCREIVEEFHSQKTYRERIIYLPDCSPCPAYFDRQLMRQAVSNLISNALKYSADFQPVLMTLHRMNGQIELSVKDYGIGIPAKDLAHLYDPFHRAANVGVISGTGLGLPITKRAIEMHGGTVMVESEVDRGTTFTITVPQDGLELSNL